MKFRSNSLTRRRSCRASTALAARGSPRPAIASRFQASSSAGYSPCSRHQALRTASSIAAVTITASSRAAAVQRWLPPTAPLTSASPRQRSSVATLIPTSRDTRSTDELSGGNSRATIRSLYACPYRATFVFQRPQRFRSYPDGNFSDTGGLLSGDCPKRNSLSAYDLCGIHCPELRRSFAPLLAPSLCGARRRLIASRRAANSGSWRCAQRSVSAFTPRPCPLSPPAHAVFEERRRA
jgi:hypothetical protein